MTPELLAKVRGLPRLPGIYKFKDAAGKTIYVGKASSLRNRVGSYFRSNGDYHGGKTAALVAQAADVEYILTGSTPQALQWESDLIKTERPKFNVVTFGRRRSRGAIILSLWTAFSRCLLLNS